ncbi:hypothetical protein EHQ61_08585 [Leptospira wolffii]|uniref:hypothetical protein n=1 Tax=Leptospira wolffii TaxID=409998 RepID=UPI0010847B43|nr:hypothetical protein [Leptospira wolffii]TGL50818.1 hypothetical protein EHQ61_08585 [Leptospira wolffii]
MFEHQAYSFLIFSAKDLKEKIEYIAKSSIQEDEFLCLHFSCHGNEDGLGIGSDFLKWSEFGVILIPLLKNKNFKDKLIITISACGANEQKLTKNISSFEARIKSRIAPPLYFFVYDEYEVGWADALLCWTILYHQIGKIDSLEKNDVKKILSKISISGLGKLIYFRWDWNSFKYKKFRPDEVG